MHAMDARTGPILWSFNTGATVYGGASASSSCVFIGYGYSIGLARFRPTWNGGNYSLHSALMCEEDLNCWTDIEEMELLIFQ